MSSTCVFHTFFFSCAFSTHILYCVPISVICTLESVCEI
uniref:Uncharacterized protein n=1 Tax=Anguilla anguilla TaxID=7936 RepID=A0A0E9UA66_ANGAN